MVTDKILVVDDIIKNIQLLGSLLGKKGYAVSYATSGEKALEMTATEDFDLVLLDIMMPGMNGFEVCQKLKSGTRTQDIPILFLTAKSEQDDIVSGLQYGAVDYLTKPINASELMARVQTQLALRHAQRSLMARNAQLEEKNKQLEQLLEANRKAMAEIKTLRGILPICSNCKKIRDDKGYWMAIELYISQHSEAEFSHGVCKECAATLYPDLYKSDR